MCTIGSLADFIVLASEVARYDDLRLFSYGHSRESELESSEHLLAIEHLDSLLRVGKVDAVDGKADALTQTWKVSAVTSDERLDSDSRNLSR